MIYTITLNPAVDKTIYVETLDTTRVNKIQNSFKDAAGKGINVSKVLNTLDVNNQIVTILAGEKGRFIVDSLGDDFDLLYESVEGNTRENVKIVNQINNDEYAFNEVGPNVSKENVFNLLNNINPTEEDIVMISGSVPNGLPSNIYAEIIEELKKTKAYVILDTSNEYLVEGVKANPDLIKPNLEELEHLTGIEFKNAQEIIDKKEVILNLGVDRVIITLGGHGALYISPRNIYFVEPIKVDALSSVSAGDSFLAGYIYAETLGVTTVEKLRWAAATATASATTVSTQPGSVKRVHEFYDRVVIKEIE